MEWVFRAIFLLVSILQALVRTSTSGQYCIHEIGVLELEGDWLYWLIWFQLFKIAVLSAWHIVLNKRQKAFFADQFDESTWIEQTTYLDDTTQNQTGSRLQSSYTMSHARGYGRNRHKGQPYYDDEDPEATALMERGRSSEEDSDEPESRHHRVKFASSAKQPSNKKHSSRQRSKSKRRRAEIVGREQRDSKAYYDVEDCADGDSDSNDRTSDSNQTHQTSLS